MSQHTQAECNGQADSESRLPLRLSFQIFVNSLARAWTTKQRRPATGFGRSSFILGIADGNSEALPIFSGGDERLYQLGVYEVAVELIQLIQPEVITLEVEC